MDKIIVNGKEIEISKDGMLQLSEEELVSASGGLVLPRDTLLYQWRCRMPDCGYISEWYDSSSECRENLKAHILETRHGLYDFYSKYLD